MARSEGGGGDEESSSERPPAVRPKRDLFLVVCRCFSVIVALAAVLCIVVNILSAIRSFQHGTDIFDGIFRCYAVAIGLFIVAAETEWEFFLKFSRVLEYWTGRGMLQIFVAVMTRAFPDLSRKRRNLMLLQDLSSYLLLACGAIYFIGGILCCGFLKRARQTKQISRDQAINDLEELERRRAELEASLIAHKN